MGCEASSSSMAMTPMSGSIKVKYFPAHGRASGLRMMLMTAGMPVENIDVQMQDWPSMKMSPDAGEFGYLPIVVAPNGKIYQGTNNVMRGFGMKLGLYNLKSPMEMYKADSAADAFIDFFDAVAKCMKDPTDEGKKKGVETLLTTVAPNTFKFIERRLAGHKFISADKLCYADYSMASLYCDMVLNVNFPFAPALQKMVDAHPRTKAYFITMQQHVKGWLDKRPIRPM